MSVKGSHNHIIAAAIAAGLKLDALGRIVYPSGKVFQDKQGNGRYKKISLSLNGKRIGVTKARVLCWLLYGPPPTAEHEADHINHDSQDDRPENLRWVTRSQNTANISAENLADRRARMRNKHAETRRILATHAELVAALTRLARDAEKLAKAPYPAWRGDVEKIAADAQAALSRVLT